MDPDDTLSPGLLQKVVHAGSRHRSFREASEELATLAEVVVSEERVRRATERVGAERVAQRDAAANEWRKLPFPERDSSLTGQSPPVACVQRVVFRKESGERAAGDSSTRRNGAAGPAKDPGAERGSHAQVVGRVWPAGGGSGVAPRFCGSAAQGFLERRQRGDLDAAVGRSAEASQEVAELFFALHAHLGFRPLGDVHLPRGVRGPSVG